MVNTHCLLVIVTDTALPCDSDCSWAGDEESEGTQGGVGKEMERKLNRVGVLATLFLIIFEVWQLLCPFCAVFLKFNKGDY